MLYTLEGHFQIHKKEHFTLAVERRMSHGGHHTFAGRGKSCIQTYLRFGWLSYTTLFTFGIPCWDAVGQCHSCGTSTIKKEQKVALLCRKQTFLAFSSYILENVLFPGSDCRDFYSVGTPNVDLLAFRFSNKSKILGPFCDGCPGDSSVYPDLCLSSCSSLSVAQEEGRANYCDSHHTSLVLKTCEISFTG